MICEKCGSKINAGLKFCTKCGSKINYEIGKGKGFLMITGILLIIFAAYGIFSQRFYFFYIIEGGFVILSYGPFFVTGILGIKYCKNIEKAKLLMCFALIVIVFAIVSFLMRGGLWTSLIGFILSICFLIGTILNLKTKGGE